MRVMVVDDHDIVREGIRASLSRDPRLEIVGEAANGKDALRRVRQCLPDVALIDLRLPDMRGEDLCREIARDFPSTKVIILTTYLSEETVRGALEAGATDYVTKSAGLAELTAALERVMDGGGPRNAHEGPLIVKQLHALVAERKDGVT